MILLRTIFNKWERFVLAGLIAIVLSMSLSLLIKDKKISELESSINLLSNEYVKSKQEEERNLQSYKTNTKAIQENTKSDLSYIQNYKGASNDDCKNANSLINSFKF